MKNKFNKIKLIFIKNTNYLEKAGRAQITILNKIKNKYSVYIKIYIIKKIIIINHIIEKRK